MSRLAVVCALTAYASSARANPWDLYGFNPRARAMGSAHTAGADDFTGVYYNPASLTIAKDPGFGFAFVLARPSLHITFDKPERPIAELEPPGADGVTFGTMFPLAGSRAARRAAVGLAINVPTSSLLDGQALDPAIPHWYMFQALPRRIVAALGIGVAPWPWISAGVGMQILAGVSGKLEYELDVVAGRFSEKTVTFDIEPRAAPIVGLEVRPIDGLRIGASYRGSISSDVELPVDLEITGIADLLILTFFRVQYTPHQIAFGASYEIAELGLTICADLSYLLWSKAPDPSVRSSIDVGGALFEGTGLDAALDAPAPGQERSVDLAFRDVFVPRLGIEWKLGPVQIRGGYGVRPSPTPEQTSGTNYVDATTHELSAGAGVRFRDPLDLLANPLIFDAAFSLFYVPSRRHEKIAPSDPIGSYDASGFVYVAGVAFRYEFGEAPATEEPDAAPDPKTPKVEPAPEPPHDPVLPDGEDPEP